MFEASTHGVQVVAFLRHDPLVPDRDEVLLLLGPALRDHHEDAGQGVYRLELQHLCRTRLAGHCESQADQHDIVKETAQEIPGHARVAQLQIPDPTTQALEGELELRDRGGVVEIDAVCEVVLNREHDLADRALSLLIILHLELRMVITVEDLFECLFELVVRGVRREVLREGAGADYDRAKDGADDTALG